MAKEKSPTPTPASEPKPAEQKILPANTPVPIMLTVEQIQRTMGALDLATKAGGLQVAAAVMPVAAALEQALTQAHQLHNAPAK